MSDMHSVWLMPGAEDAQILAGIIAELAAQFEAPTFQPHLTLVEDRSSEVAALAADVAGIAKGIAPFSARIEGVGTSDLYFRAFYARFEAQGPLLDLKQRAIRSIAPSSISAFMPHISLVYGAKDTPQRRRMSWEMDKLLAGRLIRFDHIAVVRSAQTIPIAEWAVKAVVPLVDG